jgi:hypothetical protein
MLEEHKTEIENIIAQIKCKKGFECYESGFKILCKAKDIGLDSFLECLEREPTACNFSFPFALTYLCQCPVRVYIANKMNK